VPEKPLIDPLVVAIAGVKAAAPKGDPLTPRFAPETVTTPLSRLSLPRQAPMVGVIVYCQLPVGVSSSRQVMPITVPVQVPIGLIVAAPPPAGYRLTR
jgi:hypothetical protein